MKKCGIIYENNINNFYEKLQEKLNEGYEVKCSNAIREERNSWFYAYMEKEINK